MFATRLVAPTIYEKLTTDPTISAAIGDRAFSTTTVPAGKAFPVALFYAEYSSYDGAIGTGLAGQLNMEQLRYTIRLICTGEDDTPILAAAEAQFAIFTKGRFDISVDGVHYTISTRANSEVPLNTLLEGTDFYTQLGTTYDVTVVRG
ncbi:MAG TPA: hypothetical protein VFQ54_01225 [Thermomicrobiales bacterium]|nr:hypothetical protein [Thermomicrobiales bacterium]